MRLFRPMNLNRIVDTALRYVPDESARLAPEHYLVSGVQQLHP